MGRAPGRTGATACADPFKAMGAAGRTYADTNYRTSGRGSKHFLSISVGNGAICHKYIKRMAGQNVEDSRGCGE